MATSSRPPWPAPSPSTFRPSPASASSPTRSGPDFYSGLGIIDIKRARVRRRSKAQEQLYLGRREPRSSERTETLLKQYSGDLVQAEALLAKVGCHLHEGRISRIPCC